MSSEHVDWKSPPWTLVTDQGKPHAIVPSGRPGTILIVQGWSLAKAERVVRLANELGDVIFNERLRHIARRASPHKGDEP